MAEFADIDIETLSLDDRDDAPVHVPGHIQGFGALCAIDRKLSRITWCSANAPELFGRKAEDLLGAPPETLLTPKALHDIGNALSRASSLLMRSSVGVVIVGSHSFDCFVHINADGLPVLEFETTDHAGRAEASVDAEVTAAQVLIARLRRIGRMSRFLADTASGLRDLTGYDRVMVLRFDGAGEGEVLAEDCRVDLDSLLGARIPVGDLPAATQAVLVKAPVRVIANAGAEAVRLVGDDTNAPPLDLTLASLRGASRAHLDWLERLGVVATMVLSIQIGDRLWGLIVCHHASPRLLHPSARNVVEIFRQIFCLDLERRLERARTEARSLARALQDRLIAASGKATDLPGLIKDFAEAYCNPVGADGMALVDGAGAHCFGSCPAPDVVAQISADLLAKEERGMVMTACLADRLPHLRERAAPAAGALACVLGEDGGTRLVFFRDAFRKHGLARAQQGASGDPERCRNWQEAELEAARAAQETLSQVDDALHRRVSERMERQRTLYIGELNHRVRNILALIRSISRRAKDSAGSLDSYARALDARIGALGVAHDLATHQVATGINLFDLFETEIRPFQSPDHAQLLLRGTPVSVRSELAPMLALVIHELMTNSAKYGALSVGEGSIEVEFTPSRSGVDIVWKERGGPPASRPAQFGFGLGLIEQAIPYEMDGEAELSFETDGLRARLWLPETAISAVASEELLVSPKPGPTVHDPEDLPRAVLVVEDSMVVAMDIADMLASLGIGKVKLVSNLRDAERVLEQNPPDFAILDITLRTDTSYEVARHLKERKVPFLFATGYGSDNSIPRDLRDSTVLTRPVDLETLGNTMVGLYKTYTKAR